MQLGRLRSVHINLFSFISGFLRVSFLYLFPTFLPPDLTQSVTFVIFSFQQSQFSLLHELFLIMCPSTISLSLPPLSLCHILPPSGNQTSVDPLHMAAEVIWSFPHTPNRS